MIWHYLSGMQLTTVIQTSLTSWYSKCVVVEGMKWHSLQVYCCSYLSVTEIAFNIKGDFSSFISDTIWQQQNTISVC